VFLLFRPDARLSGVVVAEGGPLPVPGARVILLESEGEVVAMADADEAGRYEIEGLADG
jgi:hypothetical protein